MKQPVSSFILHPSSFRRRLLAAAAVVDEDGGEGSIKDGELTHLHSPERLRRTEKVLYPGAAHAPLGLTLLLDQRLVSYTFDQIHVIRANRARIPSTTSRCQKWVCPCS